MARIILATSLLLQIIPVSFDKSSLPYLTKVPATLLSLVVPTRLQQPSWLMPTLETPLLFHGRVLISATCVSICELFFFRVLIVVYFKWPHNTGPMLTYLANCGSSPCSQFDITNSRWFKIAQIGRKSPGSAWAQADLSAFPKTVLSISHFIDISFSLVVTGGVATASLPSTLAPGNYLLRHEIIALHLATSLGGAEFYPACAQIQVGGSETGAPTPDELVSIPGAYHDDDPGIFDPQVFNTSAPYIFPGPPIASFVGADTSGTSNGNSSTPAPTTSTTPPTSSTASSKSCRLKKASPTSVTDALLRQHRFSRIMQRLGFKSPHWSNSTNSPSI